MKKPKHRYREVVVKKHEGECINLTVTSRWPHEHHHIDPSYTVTVTRRERIHYNGGKRPYGTK